MPKQFSITIVVLFMLVSACTEKGDVAPGSFQRWEFFTPEVFHSSIIDSLLGIRTMVEDKTNRVWVVMSNNVSWFKDGIETIAPADSVAPALGAVCSLKDSQGRLWFGSTVGLQLYDGKTWKGLYVDEHYSIRSLMEDKSGRIWIGTDKNGMIVLNPDLSVSETFTSGNCVECNSVRVMMQDPESDTIWFGTPNNLFRFDGKTFTNYGVNNGLPSSTTITSLYKSEFGTLWVGTSNGIYHLVDDEFQLMSLKYEGSRETIDGIIEDRNHVLWICTYADGMFSYDGLLMRNYPTPVGTYGFGLRSAFRDHRGVLWVAAGTGIIQIR